MSTIDKLIRKMYENPRDWRIEQLEVVAQHFGMIVRKGGGSHVIFDHPQIVELLSVPAHRPIKPIYIKKFLTFLGQLTDEK